MRPVGDNTSGGGHPRSSGNGAAGPDRAPGSASSGRRLVLWLGLGLGAIVLYLLAIEPAIRHTVSVLDSSRQIEARLDGASAEAARTESQRRTVRLGEASFGDVLGPALDRDGRVQAFSSAIGAVLATQGVEQYRLETRAGTELARGPLRDRVLAQTGGSGGRTIVRTTSDLRFRASPERAASVLAALEATPEVSAVSSVGMRKSDDRAAGEARVVDVELTLETWVVDDRGRGGRAP